MANVSALVVEGEYYRLLTAAFVHASVTHLLLNMVSLAVLSRLSQVTLGERRLLAVYLLAALGGSILTLLTGTSGSVGASGAILGVLGASLVMMPRRHLLARPLRTFLVVFLLLGFLIPGIDGAGHLGGAITGAVAAGMFAWSDGRRRPSWWATAAPLGVMATLAGLVVFAVVTKDPGPGPYDGFKSAAMARIAALAELGVSYEELLPHTLEVDPEYQVVDDGKASYTVALLQDPSRSRVLRIEFGDGTFDTRTIPKGRGVAVHTFEHAFIRELARFAQRTSVEGGTSPFSTITDVCPPGSRPDRSAPTGDNDLIQPQMCALPAG